MNVTKNELELLWELQQLLLLNRKLEQSAKVLATGEELEAARQSLIQNSSTLSAARSQHEELLRDLARVEGDLALVEKRITSDKDRLNKTAVSRDVLGLQHELETLTKRQNELEEVELELLERREESNRVMHELDVEHQRLEAALSETKARVQLQLSDLKTEHQQNSNAISELRGKITEQVLGIFDAKFLRGVAIGRLQKTSCGACNMNLTATAMRDLHAVPDTELATCPECQAILIR
jgi:predicted  nucleic acid-binding Zn-ribbon protein